MPVSEKELVSKVLKKAAREGRIELDCGTPSMAIRLRILCYQVFKRNRESKRPDVELEAASAMLSVHRRPNSSTIVIEPWKPHSGLLAMAEVLGIPESEIVRYELDLDSEQLEDLAGMEESSLGAEEDPLAAFMGGQVSKKGASE